MCAWGLTGADPIDGAAITMLPAHRGLAAVRARAHHAARRGASAGLAGVRYVAADAARLAALGLFAVGWSSELTTPVGEGAVALRPAHLPELAVRRGQGLAR